MQQFYGLGGLDHNPAIVAAKANQRVVACLEGDHCANNRLSDGWSKFRYTVVIESLRGICLSAGCNLSI